MSDTVLVSAEPALADAELLLGWVLDELEGGGHPLAFLQLDGGLEFLLVAQEGDADLFAGLVILQERDRLQGFVAVDRPARSRPVSGRWPAQLALGGPMACSCRALRGPAPKFAGHITVRGTAERW